MIKRVFQVGEQACRDWRESATRRGYEHKESVLLEQRILLEVYRNPATLHNAYLVSQSDAPGVSILETPDAIEGTVEVAKIVARLALQGGKQCSRG